MLTAGHIAILVGFIGNSLLTAGEIDHTDLSTRDLPSTAAGYCMAIAFKFGGHEVDQFVNCMSQSSNLETPITNLAPSRKAGANMCKRYALMQIYDMMQAIILCMQVTASVPDQEASSKQNTSTHIGAVSFLGLHMLSQNAQDNGKTTQVHNVLWFQVTTNSVIGVSVWMCSHRFG